MLRLGSLLVAAAVLAAATGAHSRAHVRDERQQQQTNAEQRGTQDEPVFVKVIPSEQPKDALARQESREKAAFDNETRLTNLTGDLAFYTKWLAIGTAVLAFLTGGLLVFGAFQLRDSKRSIAASEKAAQAAMISANVAAAHIQPRVAIGARGLQQNLTDGRFIVWSNTTNTGGSTAYKLQILSAVQFIEHPLKEPLPRSPTLPARDHGTIDMPPRPETGHASSRPMVSRPTEEEMGDWRAGKCALYIHGTVLYETEFGDSVELDYCQYIDWDGYELWWRNPVARDGGTADAIFRVARFGNDTRIIRKADRAT